MGMGYGANFSLVVGDHILAQVLPQEWERFQGTLKKVDIFYDGDLVECFQERELDIERAAGILMREEMMGDGAGREDCLDFLHAMQDLRAAFRQKSGLDVYANIHDSDDAGDRYDDVSGLYFEYSFQDIFEETETIKAAKEKGITYDFAYFVTYG